MKAPVTLPEKQSDLLDLAVTDAIAASKLKSVRLNMRDWLANKKLYRGKRVCTVCMAGAVMLQTPGLKPEKDQEIIPFGMSIERPMATINLMRTGGFLYDIMDSKASSACCKAGALIRDAYNKRTGRAPWRVYRKAAAILREAGL